ncbi:MAG: hypothetical protein LBM87_02580 [Ruminococcus sp.]|nr:hypothetical protein [Ruminococcus sp.]
MGNKIPKIRRIIFFTSLSIAFIIICAAIISVFTAGGKTIFYIKPNEFHPLRNPLMGYAATNHISGSDLVYVEVTWAELEPSEGVYDFKGINAKYELNLLKLAGKRIVFRFLSDRPGDTEHMDIPLWLYEQIDGEYYDNEYGKGFSPDYDNIKLMKHHENAIKALSDEYGSDNFFAYIEIGSVGHNGSFETSDEISAGIDKYILENYVEDYINNFKHSILLTPGYSYFTEEYGLGEYNPNIEDGFSDFSDNKCFGAHILKESTDYSGLINGNHLSYIVSDFSLPEETYENVGYLLKVTEAYAESDRTTGELTVSMTFSSEGAAAFPADWEPVLYIVNSRGKTLVKFPLNLPLNSIEPGKTAEVKKTINLAAFSNEYTFRLCVGVQDPITDKPCVAFAMDGEISENIFNFGSVNM